MCSFSCDGQPEHRTRPAMKPSLPAVLAGQLLSLPSAFDFPLMQKSKKAANGFKSLPTAAAHLQASLQPTTTFHAFPGFVISAVVVTALLCALSQPCWPFELLQVDTTCPVDCCVPVKILFTQQLNVVMRIRSTEHKRVCVKLNGADQNNQQPRTGSIPERLST